MMCEFWRSLHSTYRHCIPPGIIFLPGPRLQMDGKLGYGWAPQTWMSAHEVDYPDPLGSWTSETDLLEGDGLRVSYPGFILHTASGASCTARNEILGIAGGVLSSRTFTFPADYDLLEWYSATPADDPPSQNLNLQSVQHSSHQLAIILSRPRPKASPPEIGLLVGIWMTINNMIPDNGSAKTYKCQIIHRLRVLAQHEALAHQRPGDERAAR